MRRKDEKLGFSKKEKKDIDKFHGGGRDKENHWNHLTETTVVKGPIENVTREEMVIAIKAMKPGKTSRKNFRTSEC